MFLKNGWKGAFDMEQTEHVQWTFMKGGSAANLEYKCSRIALKAAMGQNGDFSAGKKPFLRTHNLEIPYGYLNCIKG